jgi:hypothetical protein
MKGSFFGKPLEWSVETVGESWQQGSSVKGTLKVKNHGTETVALKKSGVGLAHADIKKVHARTPGVLVPKVEASISETSIAPGAELTLAFALTLPANCPITDKKASFYLTYGQNLSEGHLQLMVGPLALFGKVVGLLDTFHRFKLKEVKSSKSGVDYKLIPPSSKDLANLEGLTLNFSLKDELLHLVFEFQLKKLDTTSVTPKINKETAKVVRGLGPKEYSLGRDMINQDQLLKMLEGVLGEVKIKNAF